MSTKAKVSLPERTLDSQCPDYQYGFLSPSPCCAVFIHLLTSPPLLLSFPHHTLPKDTKEIFFQGFRPSASLTVITQQQVRGLKISSRAMIIISVCYDVIQISYCRLCDLFCDLPAPFLKNVCRLHIVASAGLIDRITKATFQTNPTAYCRMNLRRSFHP